jgi:hypothetical protein
LFNTHNTVEDEDGVRVFNRKRGFSLTHCHGKESNGGYLSGFYLIRRNIFEFRGTYKVLNVDFERK